MTVWIEGRIGRSLRSERTSPRQMAASDRLGIAALEDKIVQHALVTVLNELYEADFLGFSYGFRAGRSQHQALDALSVGLLRKRMNWVLDADIRGFFDHIDHGWLMKFVAHRIADRGSGLKFAGSQRGCDSGDF